LDDPTGLIELSDEKFSERNSRMNQITNLKQIPRTVNLVEEISEARTDAERDTQARPSAVGVANQAMP